MINFNFLIPLKTLSTMNDGLWVFDLKKSKEVLGNLERTLKSIYISKQNCTKDINVNVFISGHESPFLEEYKGFFCQDYEGVNVKFIENAFDRPVDKSFYMADKERKKDSAFKWMYENFDFISTDCNFLMLFDADDLVSKDFFNVILSSFESKDCYEDACLMSGFVFDWKNRVCGFLDGSDKIFYRNCGSSFISVINREDLDPDNGFLYKLRNHVRFPEITQSLGRNLKKIYTPCVLYLVNHGQNDVSERYGESHMVDFVKQFKCSEEQLNHLMVDFIGLI